MLTARALLIAHKFATQQQKFLLYPFNLLSLFFIVFRINNILTQDVQTVGANNLLRSLISHTNLISCTLFKCVLFKEDITTSMV